MNRRELLDAIYVEIERIFGDEKYPTRPEEQAWLAEKYEISREEHLRYELILDHHSENLEEEKDEFSMAFLRNERAVCRFLEGLLGKYRGGSEVYRSQFM